MQSKNSFGNRRQRLSFSLYFSRNVTFIVRDFYFLFICKLSSAGTADLFALEIGNLACFTAENAGGLILSEDDGVVFKIDLNTAAGADGQSVSHFDGENDSAQIINFSHDSCCFHSLFSPLPKYNLLIDYFLFLFYRFSFSVNPLGAFMLGKCFCILIFISLLSAVFLGNVEAVATATVDGAAKAVTTVISLSGMMCLWCGVMNVFKKAGFIEKLSHLLSPLLRFIFPRAFRTGVAKEEIVAAVSANLLGIGNAATPFALSAMKKMDECEKQGDASDDMIMLTLLACSPVCLLPTTIITLRRAAGSAFPFKIIIPVWLGSLCCCAFTVIFAKLCAGVRKGFKKEGATKSEQRQYDRKGAPNNIGIEKV